MGQITIYLDDQTEVLVKAAVRAAGVSQSKWVADVVRERVRNQWPDSIRSLAGAWSDLPTAEQMRRRQSADLLREPL
jgi:hypothetical protein